MKKIIILIFGLLVWASADALAQRPNSGPDREKLEAARVAYITNRLSLSPEQAEKFWPMYNQYNRKRMELMREINQINKSAEGNISNAEAKTLIQNRLKLQEEMLNREKQFLQDITDAITPVQAFKLSEANRNFTRELYRRQQGGSPRND